jgi:RNA polymerase sigma-70 factor (ECF subfamily)
MASFSTTVSAGNSASKDAMRAAEHVLISRILAGEKDVFLELIRPYQRTVYTTVISMLGSKEDAEDVTQDALLKALARLHQFRRESAFGTWLIQIAINEAHMRRRKLRYGIMFSLTSEPDGEDAYIPKDFADWREIPSEALERNEIREALAKALTSLEEHYRMAFILRDVNDLSIAETANILGITQGAVKSRRATRPINVAGHAVPRVAKRRTHRFSIQRGKEAMGITCEEVWRDISDYIDDELASKQRAALDEHFAGCGHCSAVLEGTCNVIRLYRDERVLAPPEGFHDRLEGRINQQLNQRSEEIMRPSRRVVLAWALSAAAAVPLGFAIFSGKRFTLPRFGHQDPADSPVTGLVAVSQDNGDKFFHIPSCSYLHGKPKFLPVAEAIRQGYSPCAVCIEKRKLEKKG